MAKLTTFDLHNLSKLSRLNDFRVRLVGSRKSKLVIRRLQKAGTRVATIEPR
jgi:hypothetical protein